MFYHLKYFYALYFGHHDRHNCGFFKIFHNSLSRPTIFLNQLREGRGVYFCEKLIVKSDTQKSDTKDFQKPSRNPTKLVE